MKGSAECHWEASWRRRQKGDAVLQSLSEPPSKAAAGIPVRSELGPGPDKEHPQYPPGITALGPSDDSECFGNSGYLCSEKSGHSYFP